MNSIFITGKTVEIIPFSEINYSINEMETQITLPQRKFIVLSDSGNDLILIKRNFNV